MAEVLPRGGHVAPLDSNTGDLLEPLERPVVHRVDERGHHDTFTIEAVPRQGPAIPIEGLLVARDPRGGELVFATALELCYERAGLFGCRTAAIRSCREAKGRQFSQSIAHHSFTTTSGWPA